MDRVITQVQYRKALWTCPVCGLEEWEDRPMGGGASYEHTCKNGHKFNQSGSNMREFNSTINYTPKEYAVVKTEDLAKAKQDKADAWLYSVKNPPKYVEPSLQDYTNLYNEKMNEATEYLKKISEKAELAELEKNKTDGKDKIDGVKK